MAGYNHSWCTWSAASSQRTSIAIVWQAASGEMMPRAPGIAITQVLIDGALISRVEILKIREDSAQHPRRGLVADGNAGNPNHPIPFSNPCSRLCAHSESGATFSVLERNITPVTNTW